jgi:hypothetical protein
VAKPTPCPICADPSEREAIDAVLRVEGVRPAWRRWPALKLTRLFLHRRDHLGLEGPAEDVQAGQGRTRKSPPPPLAPPPPVASPEPDHEAAEVDPRPPPVEPEAPPPDPPPDDAHLSTHRTDALVQVTYADRVRHVADLIMTRRWGYGSIASLADAWGCDHRTVRGYLSAAGVALTLNRGPIEAQRAQAIADTLAIRDAALDGEEPDLKAALAAEVHLDRIRGVLAPSSPMVQVNVTQRAAEEDASALALKRVLDALEAHHPAAYELAPNAPRRPGWLTHDFRFNA